MKVSKIEITAIEMAYNLYVKGHGLTHAVRMANAKIADLSKLMNPEKNVDPALFTNAHNLSYKVKKNGVTHYYSKCTAPNEIRQIQREYTKGKSVAFLAETYGLSVSTIYNYLETEI